MCKDDLKIQPKTVQQLRLRPQDQRGIYHHHHHMSKVSTAGHTLPPNVATAPSGLIASLFYANAIEMFMKFGAPIGPFVILNQWES